MTNTSQSGIALTPKRPIFIPAWWFMRVFVKIDEGQKLKRGWGESFIPLAPGQHTIFVATAGLIGWGWKPGKATTTVDVLPGQVVHLRYQTPMLMWPFLKGKLAVTAPAATAAAA
jgi:hypothetical protein